MLITNTVLFLGLAITFVGNLLLALYSSGFQVKGGRVHVNTTGAKVALGIFALGFVIVLFAYMIQISHPFS